jgi:spoIIIJ-associated protein
MEKIKMLNQSASLDVNANTIDQAIEQGLARLGLAREQVDIEIIKEGRRGVFGIGAEEAQIRLTPKKPPAPQSPPLPTEFLPEETPPEYYEEVGKIGADYLQDLLARMGITAEVIVRLGTELVENDEEPPLVLDITGKDLGVLIGRRSETLLALQYMLRLMVSKHLSRWYPILVDVESYRVRRLRSLYQLAENMAEQAAASRRRVVLEPMPPHERRIVHMALKDHKLVFTKSVGSDDSRKVTIIPK